MLPLGPELGEWCAALHRDHGVDLRLGTGRRRAARRRPGRGGRADRRLARRRRPRRRRAGRAPEHGVAGRQRPAARPRARMRRDADGRRRPRHPRRRRHRVVAASPGRRRGDPHRALDRRRRARAARRPQRPAVTGRAQALRPAAVLLVGSVRRQDPVARPARARGAPRAPGVDGGRVSARLRGRARWTAGRRDRDQRGQAPRVVPHGAGGSARLRRPARETSRPTRRRSAPPRGRHERQRQSTFSSSAAGWPG